MKGKTLSYVIIIALVAFFAYKVQSGPSTSDQERFIGKPGPEFQVEEWISQAPETKGKFILIDFWATWCGPCIRAIPHMNELHAEFGAKLAVIGVSREGRATVESMKSPVMEYYSAIDTQSRMASFFEIRSIPHIVMMDPNGTVLWKGHPARLSKEQIKSFLENQ